MQQVPVSMILTVLRSSVDLRDILLFSYTICFSAVTLLVDIETWHSARSAIVDRRLTALGTPFGIVPRNHAALNAHLLSGS
jgi:hypothetical protein